MLMSEKSVKKFMIASLKNGYILYMHFGFDCQSFYMVGARKFNRWHLSLRSPPEQAK
jgi:hypothetical protein